MSKYYQEEIECMEHSKLEELQLERLRDVAVRCYENIPLYKQRFDELASIRTISNLSKTSRSFPLP